MSSWGTTGEGTVRAMPVRPATAEDLDEIEAMIHELAVFERAPDEVAFDPAELAAHLFGPDPAAGVLIATPPERPDVAAGMAVWYRTFSTWVGRPGIWLEDLFVRPEHRRHGLASELLAGLQALTDGRVEWAVLDWNVDAIRFYERLGAQPVDGWSRYRLDPELSRPGR
jgi:GNAT superfamily N-acetyltransferase